jgi:hypothetical protein
MRNPREPKVSIKTHQRFVALLTALLILSCSSNAAPPPVPEAVNYKWEIFKIILDKGLLALALLILGYFINKKLEVFKQRRLFSTEAVKLRLMKIAEVWEMLYILKKETQFVINLAYKKEIPSEEVMRAALAKHKTVYEELNRVLTKNSFWIGKDQRVKIDGYGFLLGEQLSEAVATEGNKDTLHRLREAMEMGIDDLRTELLNAE